MPSLKGKVIFILCPSPKLYLITNQSFLYLQLTLREPIGGEGKWVMENLILHSSH
jgi:hypothetical protein